MQTFCMYLEVSPGPKSHLYGSPKAFIEKVEELNEDKTDSQICVSPTETSEEDGRHSVTTESTPANDRDGQGIHEDEVQISGSESDKSSLEPEDVSSSSNEEKCLQRNGSKLSAAAEPFNPGAYHLTHMLISAAVTSVYDVRAKLPHAYWNQWDFHQLLREFLVVPDHLCTIGRAMLDEMICEVSKSCC
ncbi:hypothetical protein HAX54_002705 [Datura stramonium]|uniref:Uncharacterized protein n=1 Tax=Datura stramonium TaxID=4076 RepID=A0ABS8RT40_DATST|nr:hypothetical protein [Datura stramonium]